MKHGTILVIAVVAIIGCYEIFLAAAGAQVTEAPDEDSALSMVQGGANPSMLGKFGIQDYTPLQYAAKCNWTKLIDALLKKGVDVNARSPGSPVTALQVAARFGNAEAAEHLLKAGANPNFHDEHQQSALMMASEVAVPDAYGFLVPNDAKIQDYAKIIKLLVAAGADVAAKDDAGHTASDIVLTNRNASFMEESLLALKSSKPTNKVDAISYKKIAAILTSINNKNFSSLSILLKSSDPDVRTRALAVLDEIAVGSPTSRNNDENWDWDMYMRQSHIEGSAHSPSYLARNLFDATLMQSILNAAHDSEARVRAACMFALAVITPADSEITNVVKNRLVSDPDKTVKLRCVETLGRYAAKQRNQASEIGKMMQSATQHDPDCAVRLGAAIVLQMIHSELENNTKDASRAVILAQEFGMMTGVAIKDHIGTNKIPCRKGVVYGVCVVPDDSDKAPDLKVRLTAPFARSNWPDNRVRSGRHIDVSPDRRAAIYSMQSPCGNFSEVTWMVADDDRPGDYKAEVLVNNKVSKTFDFEIVASK